MLFARLETFDAHLHGLQHGVQVDVVPSAHGLSIYGETLPRESGQPSLTNCSPPLHGLFVFVKGAEAQTRHAGHAPGRGHAWSPAARDTPSRPKSQAEADAAAPPRRPGSGREPARGRARVSHAQQRGRSICWPHGQPAGGGHYARGLWALHVLASYSHTARHATPRHATARHCTPRLSETAAWRHLLFYLLWRREGSLKLARGVAVAGAFFFLKAEDCGAGVRFCCSRLCCCCCGGGGGGGAAELRLNCDRWSARSEVRPSGRQCGPDWTAVGPRAAHHSRAVTPTPRIRVSLVECFVIAGPRLPCARK